MKKADFEKIVQASCEASTRVAGSCIDAIFTAIHAALMAGEKVRIEGLGTFEKVDKAARIARHPKTGEKIEVPAGFRVKFKASGKVLV